MTKLESAASILENEGSCTQDEFTFRVKPEEKSTNSIDSK
jgi:hypothetical protein